MRPLHHLNAIGITGQDALAFCQSLVTSNLSVLAPDQWHASAWCNAQGQVTVVMLVRVSEYSVDCVVPQSQASSTASALSRYTIGRQVSIGAPRNVMADWWPAETSTEHPRLAHDPNRVLLVTETAPRSTEDLAFEKAWRHADLSAGLAWLCPALSARFLPQSLGLERLSGLSYKKGCYPGQEVIAKVHYRGQLKQHLVLLAVSPEASTLSPDMALFAQPNDQSPGASKPCGVVIDRVGDRALAVVRATLSAGAVLVADSPDGTESRITAGQIMDLPNL